MAEQSQRDEERKSQLIAELERSRAGLARDMRGVRQGLDVGSHVKHAILRQKTLWFTGAAVTGWLLSRIPGRLKEPKEKPQTLLSRFMPEPKEAKRSGWLLALLGLAGTLLKPAVTSFLTHKLTEFATRDHQPEPPRRASRY